MPYILIMDTTPLCLGESEAVKALSPQKMKSV